MDPKAASSNRSYEDFEPFCIWHPEDEQYILHIYLKGFKKEQLKVQVNDKMGKLAIYGERHLGGSRWIRLRKEVPLPKDGAVDKIEAKFSRTNEILYIVLPKKVEPLTTEPESKPEEAFATSSGTEIEQKLALEDKSSVWGVKISKRRAMKVAVVVAVVVMVVAIGTQIAQLVHRDPHQHHAAPNDHVVNV